MSYTLPPKHQPFVFYKGEYHRGEAAVNAVLNKASPGVGIKPMKDEEILKLREMKQVAELKGSTFEKFYKDDDKIREFFSFKQEELKDLALNVAKRDVTESLKQHNFSMKTVGKTINTRYPKIYRFTEGTDFDTFKLARLHQNCERHPTHEDKRVFHVEEFMKMLDGMGDWFFLIEDGNIAQLSLPEEWQITYPGEGQHGGYYSEDTRMVCFSQVVGPPEWELLYTEDVEVTKTRMAAFPPPNTLGQ